MASDPAPMPREADFPQRRDYLTALARRPEANPKVWIAETPLDVDRADPPVTIFYTYQEARRAVHLMGVFRDATEVSLSAREETYIKTWIRSMHRSLGALVDG